MPNSTRQNKVYIGLMSGTSVDAVDAVIISIRDSSLEILNTLSVPIPTQLQSAVHALSMAHTHEVDAIGHIDRQLGTLFAEAALRVADLSSIPMSQVNAIGSHGQTIRHRPQGSAQSPSFTWQIGDANTIAHITGVTTVADFRRRDLAAGGQGAPLAPLFHQGLAAAAGGQGIFLNIGGLSNLTVIRSGAIVSGFDTGPGNTLIDHWFTSHCKGSFDLDGAWALSGQAHSELVAQWLSDPYFEREPPKSTGREYFNHNWLSTQTPAMDTYPPEDIAASLVELTAVAAARAATTFSDGQTHLYVCGGGANNPAIMARLAAHCPNLTVCSTLALGIHHDWVEAAAFAWLAHERLNDRRFDLGVITGSAGAVPLGVIYPA